MLVVDTRTASLTLSRTLSPSPTLSLRPYVNLSTCALGIIFQRGSKNKDLKAALKADTSGKLAQFWKCQAKAFRRQAKGQDARGMRWNSDVIRVALSVFTKSKAAYSALNSSGVIKLPSQRLLRSYIAERSWDEGISEAQGVWYRERFLFVEIYAICVSECKRVVNSRPSCCCVAATQVQGSQGARWEEGADGMWFFDGG